MCKKISESNVYNKSPHFKNASTKPSKDNYFTLYSYSNL